jgi:hypothetical protein
VLTRENRLNDTTVPAFGLGAPKLTVNIGSRLAKLHAVDSLEACERVVIPSYKANLCLPELSVFQPSYLWLSELLEVGAVQLVVSKLVVGHESFGDVIMAIGEVGDRMGSWLQQIAHMLRSFSSP